MGSFQVPQLKLPEPPDLLGQAGKALQLKSLMAQQAMIPGQQQLQQQQIQAGGQENQIRQSGIDEDAAIKKALADAGGDIRKALPIITQVAPTKGIALQKQIEEWDKASIDKKKSILELHEKTAQRLGQLAGTVTDQPSYEKAIQQAATEGVLEPEHAQQMLSQPYDPNVVKQFQQQALTAEQQITQAKDQLKIQAEADKTKVQQAHDKAMEVPAAEKEFQAYYQSYLGAKGLPKNAKSELAARQEYKKMGKSDATVVIQTTDENGNPVQKIVPKVAGAEYAKGPTSTTQTMRETAPEVTKFVDRINPLIDQLKGQLGPGSGRWSEFWAGKVGAKDPQFTKLRTDVGLLTTLLMRMHVGARGGTQMIDHFRGLIDAGKQDPDNMKAALEEIRTYAGDLSNPKGGAQVGGGQSNSGAPPKTDDPFAQFGGKKR